MTGFKLVKVVSMLLLVMKIKLRSIYLPVTSKPKAEAPSLEAALKELDASLDDTDGIRFF